MKITVNGNMYHYLQSLYESSITSKAIMMKSEGKEERAVAFLSLTGSLVLFMTPICLAKTGLFHFESYPKLSLMVCIIGFILATHLTVSHINNALKRKKDLKKVKNCNFFKAYYEYIDQKEEREQDQIDKDFCNAYQLVENIKLLTDKNIVSCEIYDTGSIKKNKFWVWYRKEDDSIQKVDFQNIALRVNEMYKVPELEWDAGQLFINLSEHQYQEWN